MDDGYSEFVDPEFVKLERMFKKIRNGHHNLVQESIATEMHFRDFVLEQEEVRQKWTSAEKETHRLRSMVQGSATDKSRSEGQIQNMRQQLQKEFDRRKDAEKRAGELQRVVDTLRDVCSGDRVMTQEDQQRLYECADTIKRNLRPAESALWSSVRKSEDFDAGRISYDRSDDEEDDEYSTTRREYMKTKDGEYSETIRTTERPDGDIEIIAQTRVRIPENGPVEARSSLTTRPRRSVNFADPLVQRRSQSVPRLIDESKETRFRRSREEVDTVLSSDVTSQDSDLDSVVGNANLYAQPDRLRRRSRSVARGLDARQHEFVSKTFLVKEKCSYCEKMIGFSSTLVGVKCKNCSRACHTKCQGFLPVPCHPLMDSGISAQKPNGHVLDFTSFTSDKGRLVPAIVDQCISLIEKHIDNAPDRAEEGLYRLSGAQREIEKLKQECVKSRSTVSINERTDIHVVCGLLKNFLRSLREPLITHKHWEAFAAAASSSGNQEIYRLINLLPPANRVTLARVMLHLQKVADSPAVRMPIKNLEIAIAPSLIGNSKSGSGSASNVQLESEALKQRLILSKLFHVTRQYWSDILSRDHGPSLNDTNNTFHDVPADSFLDNPVTSSYSFTRNFFGSSNSKNDRRPRRDNARNFESPMMSD